MPLIFYLINDGSDAIKKLVLIHYMKVNIIKIKTEIFFLINGFRIEQVEISLFC